MLDSMVEILEAVSESLETEPSSPWSILIVGDWRGVNGEEVDGWTTLGWKKVDVVDWEVAPPRAKVDIESSSEFKLWEFKCEWVGMFVSIFGLSVLFGAFSSVGASVKFISSSSTEKSDISDSSAENTWRVSWSHLDVWWWSLASLEMAFMY